MLNDRQLLEVFECARGCGALVMVHCEGYDAIKFMTERLEGAGKTSPYYHAVSRPESVEREATHRAISRGELLDTPIMIVHVSGREPMQQIRWAQQKGLKVYGETCTQYISLTAEDMKGLNMDETGGKYVCSLPPRDRASWDAIWEGISTGVFQTFSSDHCPVFLRAFRGQKELESAHVLPLGAQWNYRRRGAPADPVLQGRQRGPDHGQRIRGADLDQPRQDLRPLPKEGLDRPAPTPTSPSGTPSGARRSARKSCITARTTRPMKACRLRAGPS